MAFKKGIYSTFSHVAWSHPDYLMSGWCPVGLVLSRVSEIHQWYIANMCLYLHAHLEENWKSFFIYARMATIVHGRHWMRNLMALAAKSPEGWSNCLPSGAFWEQLFPAYLNPTYIFRREQSSWDYSLNQVGVTLSIRVYPVWCSRASSILVCIINC
jgi:hypothetical protein